MTKELYVCPECGSDNICKLSLIHKKGISRGSGVGFVSGGGFVDISTRSQTAASASVSPPTRPFIFFFRNLAISIIFSLVGTFIFACLHVALRNAGLFHLLVLLGYVSFLAFLLVKVVIIDSYVNAISYRSDIIRWRNSYQCQRCGSEFVLTF
jgi:DNA-directed RNA polymerase subunit RPC12/RpoP